MIWGDTKHLPEKWLFCQIKVISKKKKLFTYIETTFLSNLRCSPKKIFTNIETIFQSKLRRSQKRSSIYFYFSIYFLLFCWLPKKGKGGGGWVGILNILGGQNCPKHMKLPKILMRNRHLKTKREGQCPPAPTSYATGDSKKQASHHVVNRIAGHSIPDAGAVVCYEKQGGLKRIEQFNQINALMSSRT